MDPMDHTLFILGGSNRTFFSKVAVDPKTSIGMSRLPKTSSRDSQPVASRGGRSRPGKALKNTAGWRDLETWGYGTSLSLSLSPWTSRGAGENKGLEVWSVCLFYRP